MILFRNHNQISQEYKKNVRIEYNESTHKEPRGMDDTLSTGPFRMGDDAIHWMCASGE